MQTHAPKPGVRGPALRRPAVRGARAMGGAVLVGLMVLPLVACTTTVSTYPAYRASILGVPPGADAQEEMARGR